MPTAAKKQPKIVQIGVSYTVGFKANLGDFESADVRISRDEKWDVSDLTADEAKKLWNERFSSMKKEVGLLSQREYNEVMGVDPNVGVAVEETE